MNTAQIKSDTHALALALRLAITAPSEAQHAKAMRLINAFAGNCTAAQIKAAKKIAAENLT